MLFGVQFGDNHYTVIIVELANTLCILTINLSGIKCRGGGKDKSKQQLALKEIDYPKKDELQLRLH